jgi:hypothetical protein
MAHMGLGQDDILFYELGKPKETNTDPYPYSEFLFPPVVVTFPFE